MSKFYRTEYAFSKQVYALAKKKTLIYLVFLLQFWTLKGKKLELFFIKLRLKIYLK